MKTLMRFFWSDLTDDECSRFGLLAIIFFFVIAATWILRIARDTLFFTVAFPVSLGWSAGQGGLMQPYAKSFSVLFIICAVGIYSRLIDYFSRHRLFYILGSFFSLIFSLVASILFFGELYGYQAIGKVPLAVTGWLAFFAVESSSSLMVALFWSFVVSISDAARARIGFPLILVGGQLGALFGSILGGQIGKIWQLMFGGVFCLAMVMALIYYFASTQMKETEYSSTIMKQHEQQESFFHSFIIGLQLMFKHPYLLGIAVVTTFHEMIAIIVEYQMYRQAAAIPMYATQEGFAAFLGFFGIATNTLSFLTVLLGTSYLLKRLGLRNSLLLYAGIVSVGLASQYASFLAVPGASLALWTTFTVMVLIKGLGFALVIPSKEIMYIPTSKEVQFKTKGWVETFGARSAKMGGAQLSNVFKHQLDQLMTYGTVVSFVLIFSWASAAFYVGRKNRSLIAKGELIQ